MNPNAVLAPAGKGPPLTRHAWVELQLMCTFVRASLPTLHAAIVLTVLTTVILYRDVQQDLLGLWATAALCATLLRYYVLHVFNRRLRGRGFTEATLRDFVRLSTWAWTVSGLVWGALMFIFLSDAPLYCQFLCLMILVAMAGLAVSNFASCMGCFNGFVYGIGVSIFTSQSAKLLMVRNDVERYDVYGMLLLMFLYGVVIELAGRRFHRVHVDALELQFDNAALIASLTEQSRAAMEAVAIKNRFIASAAHDLRQPVHALDLYAGWLAAEPEFVEQIAPKIVRSTKAVADLFDSLFDLAGLDSDPLRVHAQDVDLAALVKDLEVQYAPFAHERGLRLRTRSTPARARTDPVLLKRLVGNLLSNALRNTRQGGVLLALRCRNGVWCIEVWDTGVGIASEHQKAIFQEFYRIPMQGTEEGFGLGLAIVSRLSHALSHPVYMASRVGRGSVFGVEMPTSRVGPKARKP